jgi:hypothetical protein
VCDLVVVLDPADPAAQRPWWRALGHVRRRHRTVVERNLDRITVLCTLVWAFTTLALVIRLQ